MRRTRRQFLEGTVALGLTPGAWLQGRSVEGEALRFGLDPDERGELHDAWVLYATLLPPEVRRGAPATGVVDKAIAGLAELIRGRSVDVPDGALKHPEAPAGRALDGPGPIVVFADHHLSVGAHRHNAFSGTRRPGQPNRDLFLAVLERYASAGYTLVENGDAEDLVVVDPALYPGELALRRELVGRGPKKDRPSSLEILAALDARRRTFRAGLLSDLLSDPANTAYYAALTRFAREGRLVRVAGNHDYQVAGLWAEATARARRVTGVDYPGSDVFCSLLAVRRTTEAWTAVVMHGHPFDAVASPVNAGRYAETIDECLGAFFQGADRVWPWAEARRWADGAPFPNVLASGAPVHTRGADAPDPSYALPSADDPRRERWTRREAGPDAWERLFGHPIAEEWGRDGVPGPLASGGSAALGFRRVEELALAAQLPVALGGGTPPTLILGHGHAPRAQAVDASGVPCEWYLGCGAVGRYEGLVWGVELVDGEARVVSWHPDPFPVGPPVRRVWRPDGPWREVLASRVERLA